MEGAVAAALEDIDQREGQLVGTIARNQMAGPLDDSHHRRGREL